MTVPGVVLRSQRAYCLTRTTREDVLGVSRFWGRREIKEIENAPRHTMHRGPPYNDLSPHLPNAPRVYVAPPTSLPDVYVIPAHEDSFLASEAGRMRVPGIRAGLNERSQSAYAMPAPKPVPSATGHARPDLRDRRGRRGRG